MASFNLGGKNILITGAASGIGRATAVYLHKCAAKLLLVDRREDRLQQLSLALNGSCFVACDLIQLDRIEDIFAVCIGSVGKLNGLVHCAGIAPIMKVADNDVAVMQQTFAVNYFSFVELVKYFSMDRYSEPDSSIVAISSINAQIGSNRQAVYSGSKAALNASIKSMARELMGRRIRVNAIMPGAVETDMLAELRGKSPNLDQTLSVRQPLGILPPDAVAFMVAYLISDQGRYLSGAVLPLDGGSLLFQ